MRNNGTLRYLVSQSSSFNEDGVPTQGTANWSDPIECFIRTITHNNRGTYQDGQWTQASYEVLIERQHLEATPTRVQLSRNETELGEYEVQDCQSVSLDRYKIIV